jgi:hypothetical protein
MEHGEFKWKPLGIQSMRILSEKKAVALCPFPPGDGLLQPSATPESPYPEGLVFRLLPPSSRQQNACSSTGDKREGERTGDALVIDHCMAYFGDVIDETSTNKLPRLASQY